MELNSYQAKVFEILYKPGRPTFTEQELLEKGIDFDLEEFRLLIKQEYINCFIDRSKSPNSFIYQIAPLGVTAYENHIHAKLADSRQQTFEERSLEIAQIANRRSTWSNVLSGAALFVSLLPWLWKLVQKIISLF